MPKKLNAITAMHLKNLKSKSMKKPELKEEFGEDENNIKKEMAEKMPPLTGKKK